MKTLDLYAAFNSWRQSLSHVFGKAVKCQRRFVCANVHVFTNSFASTTNLNFRKTHNFKTKLKETTLRKNNLISLPDSQVLWEQNCSLLTCKALPSYQVPDRACRTDDYTSNALGLTIQKMTQLLLVCWATEEMENPQHSSRLNVWCPNLLQYLPAPEFELGRQMNLKRNIALIS